jgi:fatty-acyl-CoA synthase
MMDRPLLISDLFEHGRRLYAGSRVITVDEGGDRVGTYAEVADRTEQLAKALIKLGVQREDRVGTFCWNSQEHLEAYFAISSMGAVMHTLNIRLFPEQLAFVINHAQDKVIIVDDTLVPLLAKVAKDMNTVKHIIVVGGGDDTPLHEAPHATLHRYEDLLSSESPGIEWPVLDERAPASMAYTSGTTGDPKGVVYSHRSTVLPHHRADVPRELLGAALCRMVGRYGFPSADTVSSARASRRHDRASPSDACRRRSEHLDGCSQLWGGQGHRSVFLPSGHLWRLRRSRVVDAGLR